MSSYKLLKSTSVALSNVNEWCGRVLAWLILGIAIVTFLVVILRYGFNAGSIALQESISYMHGLVFMLGAAYALKHNAHVRVDIFYSSFTRQNKAWVNLLGHTFLLVPVCIFIIFISYEYVSAAWQIKEGSIETGGLPFLYLLKFLIPLMAILLLLQAIAEILQNFLVIAGRPD